MTVLVGAIAPQALNKKAPSTGIETKQSLFQKVPPSTPLNKKAPSTGIETVAAMACSIMASFDLK